MIVGKGGYFMRVCLAVLSLSVACVATAQSPADLKYLVSNNRVYAFGDQRQIATGGCTSLQPSPDGKFVAMTRIVLFDPLDEIRRKTDRPKVVLSIWTASSGATWDLADFPIEGLNNVAFQWSSSAGDGVLAVTREVVVDGEKTTETMVYGVTVPGKQRRVVGRYLRDDNSAVAISPDGSKLLITGIHGQGDEVLDTSTGRRLRVTDGDKFWRPDGSLVGNISRADGSYGRFKVDLSNGRATPLGPDDLRSAAIVQAAFDLEDSPLDKEGSVRLLVALPSREVADQDAPSVSGRTSGTHHSSELDKLLEADPSLMGPVVLDVDPGVFAVSSTGKYVVYGKRGGVYVCSFETPDIKWLQDRVRRKVQNKAMSQAKQVTLAMLMYSSDYDDLLPRASDWQDTVYPYVKNRDLFNGFVFSMDGQDISKVNEPASTMLGTVDTPYGRAVAYLDGHVKWEGAPGSSKPLALVVGDDRRLRT